MIATNSPSSHPEAGAREGVHLDAAQVVRPVTRRSRSMIGPAHGWPPGKARRRAARREPAAAVEAAEAAVPAGAEVLLEVVDVRSAEVPVTTVSPAAMPLVICA